MIRFILVSLLLLCAITPFAFAKEAKPTGDDPAVEQRLTKLSQELRCLVCQNETLADSRADLAEDLRREIREQIKAGKSDKEIIDFLTARYGQFVLYRPRVTPMTYLLWFGPFVLLLGGLWLLFAYIKQRRDSVPEAPLSADERRRAEELLASAPGKETT
ncbi:MAG TPA: cytochrome c-type biogenesis protein [Pyrinomonadaceae bacterium]|jgi:cytochrome c-type biogenesis protein CcmH|nr:cytochrome c-type biogenesis protein [Pyrinomonadaceae bacterium]